MLRERLGRDETPVILLFRPRSIRLGDVDSPVYRSAVEAVTAQHLAQSGSEKRGQLPQRRRPRLRSKDGQAELCRGATGTRRRRRHCRFRALRQQMSAAINWKSCWAANWPPTSISAPAGARHLACRNGQFRGLSLLLVWVFGSVVAATLPLIVGVVTIVLSVAILKTFTLFIDVSVYAANVVSMLGLGWPSTTPCSSCRAFARSWRPVAMCTGA
jgi:hypothetical protein